MNNLADWEEAPERVMQAIKKSWEPHFEILQSEDPEAEPLVAFFILEDTTEEWKLFNDSTDEDFADYMEEAKEELLEVIGFDLEQYMQEPLTEELIARMNCDLKNRMSENDLRMRFFNMLMYSEWVEAPAAVLERKYDEEIAQGGLASAT